MKAKIDFGEIIVLFAYLVVPFIRNLLISSTLIAYISNLTWNFYKQLKLSDSSIKALQDHLVKNKLDTPMSLNLKLKKYTSSYVPEVQMTQS